MLHLEHGAGISILHQVGQKYPESFEMRCWRKMKISLTDHVKNDVNEIKKERIILHTIKRRKANLVGHILHRNCFLKHVIEGKKG